MSNNTLSLYMRKKKRERQIMWKKVKASKNCYWFILPYALLFLICYVIPIAMSLFLSFTYFNVLEAPEFRGMQNYVNLILADDVFLTAVKNTFVLAGIIGPVSYIASFLFAWMINELPRYLRAVVVVVFYAPSLAAGSTMAIWKIIFNNDAYGWINSLLQVFGVEPILWLSNPSYMLIVVIIVSVWSSMGAGFLGFVAGFQGLDKSQYEAAYVDGLKNRMQELWYITLPSMKPMLMFGAINAITTAFNVSAIPEQLCGNPSTDYAVHTVVTHLNDYGGVRYEMGYASAIATVLFLAMLLCNKFIQKLLSRVGTN
ncbi:MAG: sugar ABC transporter permease [Lachnospiraceae bacterium]|nr:sugar ABC transporter permease [Lachnospiraceae bacterium]